MSDVWLRKCSSHEEAEEADREFWAQMTGDERVAAVEDMRLNEKVSGDEDLGRLRRVVRIFQRS
jgi:hypothetical protein